MPANVFPSFALVMLSSLCCVAQAQDSSKMALDWIKQHAVPIKTIEPGDDLSDLQFLDNVWKDVRIVGLGGSSHGTREYEKVRHRLVQYLVIKKGFTAIALESSFSDCEPINDYILNGMGNLTDALSLQGYSPWDNEEFKSMLEWLRKYNTNVPEEKKVHFYGTDIPTTFQRVGRKKVRDFVGKYAPDQSVTTDSIFRALGDEDHGWPTRLDTPALQRVFLPLHELLRYVNTHRVLLSQRSSPAAWEETRKHLEVMEQGLIANLRTIPPPLQFDSMGRDDFMAKNLLYLIESRQPDQKFIFMAHDFHVSAFTQRKSVGFYLRQIYGDKYYALGLECHEGVFTTREILADGRWGDYKVDTFPPVPKPVTEVLKEVGQPWLFVDWRPARDNLAIDRWLDTPCYYAQGGARSQKTSDNVQFKKVKGIYDGFLFIERSTPTHPTANALARSAARIGF